MMFKNTFTNFLLFLVLLIFSSSEITGQNIINVQRNHNGLGFEGPPCAPKCKESYKEFDINWLNPDWIRIESVGDVSIDIVSIAQDGLLYSIAFECPVISCYVKEIDLSYLPSGKPIILVINSEYIFEGVKP